MTRIAIPSRPVGRALVLAAAVILPAFTTGCGGGGSSAPPPPPPTSNPTLSSVSPIVAEAGSAGFTLTANGANFTSSSQVVFHGSTKTTMLVSASQLTAAIAASDVAQVSPAAGYPVAVQTGSNTTSAVSFYVVPVAGPRIASVNGGGTTANLNIGLTADSQATPLLLTDVGVGGTAGVTGGEVKQGASATLLLVGNGIVPGTFYVISGPGDVSVTQPVATDFSTCSGSSSGGGNMSTPCVNLSVSVSGTAAPGPRNILVTNPGGEVTAFVGGLLITQ